ncbi:2-oxo-4-hydroxy-4-carboxy-5-ureidoimidazoline decarboxylase [Bacillus alkalicellulosilyticus]|uniref:2-oxo-4-hydroxy-4-carboxy-5-ureidoimidazoline decarboxylase n=1 Tax=Alkalihalobacterium alkalicellulosilyticum TaxID=1912214 RepID=UPI0009968BE1|nr:2-oxo-4-hydroxy-4-carboxy-5-ureidoimidazoline decarboxylase [Bacillus alkalicellulosilyticus]
MLFTMDEVNKLSDKEFIEKIGIVFENSPWVSEQAIHYRPFSTVDEMYRMMIQIVTDSELTLQLSLLRAHPDLGTRMVISDASKAEQRNAGLQFLTEVEYNAFATLNQRYVQRFGFPFILAVRGHDKYSIKEHMEQRMNNESDEEIKTAIQEVCKIVQFRIIDLIVN